MLVNCFFAFKWLVHSRGCSCLSCTNKTVGYCSVGALETSAPPESTLGYFTSTFFTLPLAVRTMLMPRCRFCMRTPPRV